MTLGALMASTAWTCPVPTHPNADATYKTIVLAEVVGLEMAIAQECAVSGQSTNPCLNMPADSTAAS
jgi:hypothetical protein